MNYSEFYLFTMRPNTEKNCTTISITVTETNYAMTIDYGCERLRRTRLHNMKNKLNISLVFVEMYFN